jgi:hypothetical protein
MGASGSWLRIKIIEIQQNRKNNIYNTSAD